MIKLDKVEVFNLEGALRGMRNAMNSHDKSDSYWENDSYVIGEVDLALAKKLVKGGTDHSKFMRQIMLSMDITAPLYFFKEFDTYKVGTVANSTSTMHKLGSRNLTADDFSVDDPDDFFYDYLNKYNAIIERWREDKSEQNFRYMIQHLLDSYNQTRTVTMNYQVARAMYFARKSHKLSEWREFCSALLSLPYSELITIT